MPSSWARVSPAGALVVFEATIFTPSVPICTTCSEFGGVAAACCAAVGAFAAPMKLNTFWLPVSWVNAV